MSLLKMSVLGAFHKLSKIHNDVARLVFKHDLTNGENAKNKVKKSKDFGAFLNGINW